MHVGMVHYIVYRIAGVCSTASRLHFADSRSCGWNQLLCPFESCGERSTGKSFRRIAAAMAAFVLVLWASRGLHRDLAGSRDRLAHSGQQLPATTAQP